MPGKRPCEGDSDGAANTLKMLNDAFIATVFTTSFLPLDID